MLDDLLGAIGAWAIAFFSIFLFEVYAVTNRKGISPTALPKLSFISSLVLVFLAIDVCKPFPFLNESLSTFVTSSTNSFLQMIFEQTKISSLLLLTVVFFGTVLVLSRSGVEREGQRKDTVKIIEPEIRLQANQALKSFAMMTLLPIAVQFWVLVAATDKLTTFSGMIYSGLFILSGPASWQFASQILLLNTQVDETKKGFAKITALMVVSLMGTVIATFIGLFLRTQSTRVQVVPLQYLASYSLVIVPYFFFYSYWGEKWHEERPIATIMALIVLGLFSAIEVTNILFQFIASSLTWSVLLVLPYILYSNESFRLTYECPQCKKEGKTSNIRIFKWRKLCSSHPKEPIAVTQELVEERKSLLRYVKFLVYTRFKMCPSTKNVVLGLVPDKAMYKTGEKVTINVKVKNDQRKTGGCSVYCELLLHWRIGRQKLTIASSSSWIRSGETASWSFNGPIPALPTEPMPPDRAASLLLDAKVSLTEFRKMGYFKQSIPFPRWATKTLLKKVTNM